MSLLNVPFQRIRSWFNPNDPDPRNRTLRYLSVGMFIGSMIGLLQAIFLFEDTSIFYLPWVLISFFPGSEAILSQVQEPVVNGTGIFHAGAFERFRYIGWTAIFLTSTSGSLISIWFIIRHKLRAAAYALVTQLVIVTMFVLFAVNEGNTEVLLPQMFMVLVIVTGFLLAKRAIWIMCLLLVVLTPIILKVQAAISGRSGWTDDGLIYMTTTVLLYLSVVGLLIYAFRVEFDARASAWEKARLAELEQERLRELDRVKNDFLFSMSHDLRTPLHSIIGLSSGILNGIAGDIDEELRTDIETISTSGKHLLELVNGVLELAKLESGSMTLTKQLHSIVDILREALRIVQPQADTKGLTVVANVSENLPPSEVDSTAIHQVMLNLLNNAIKFTDKGTIQVEAAQKDDAVVVCVKDSGIGIPKEHQQNLFSKFYQVSAAHQKKGTGLGLAISKRLIELHNGNIWVESTAGKGSSFYFSLPVVHNN